MKKDKKKKKETDLADLEVKDSDGAPVGRVSIVAVHCLLVSLISLIVFLLRHVAAPDQVVSLGVIWIWKGC